MGKAHAAKNIRGLAELNVLVAYDLDPVTPGVEEIEKSAGQYVHSRGCQRLADSLLVIDDQSEVPAVI
jgi:hypothetical protein